MTSSDQPIAIYDQSPSGLVEAPVEAINAGYGWTLADIVLADIDGDGLHEVACSFLVFGTIGSFLLLYKYRAGRYEILKGTLDGTPGFAAQPNLYHVFNNAFLNDFDGDGIPEIVSMPKRGFAPPGLTSFDQNLSRYDQFRLIWKWDTTLAQLRIVRCDVETQVSSIVGASQSGDVLVRN